MAGGLLNLIAVGNANIFLTGNPTKTYFRVAYSKYTNFGMQKFRIDFDGTRDLRLTEDSVFTFKFPRHAELIMDTYLVITLPDIWSPIYSPTSDTNYKWVGYEYRWIKDLGTHIIKEVVVQCGSFLLSRYSGDYLAAMVDRDFTAEKKHLFNSMSGNLPELNDPENAFGRYNSYPNAFLGTSTTATGTEPSIRGRKLYIPLNTWFTLDSRCAFPLISNQYNDLEIVITLRPIQELFQVRDIFDEVNSYPYIQPDFNQAQFQMYRFLQSPPAVNTSVEFGAYTNQTNTWNADIHLMSTYVFLSKDEAKLFAQEDQVYLVKDVFQYNFDNITGSNKVKLTSNGMIASWMWFFQRNDVNMRNEWSNYTNWPYRNLPSNLLLAPQYSNNTNIQFQYNGNTLSYPTLGPYYNPNLTDPTNNVNNTGFFISGDFNGDNQKNIMETMAIVLDGKYRENTLDHGVFDYVEKYTRTNGFAKEGLYCYNFCLDTNPLTYQPSGAMNLGKFRNVELEFTTYTPTLDTTKSSFQILCDANGNVIGTNKSNWKLYEYNFNLTVLEERYNIVSFIGGNCGLLYAR